VAAEVERARREATEEALGGARAEQLDGRREELARVIAEKDAERERAVAEAEHKLAEREAALAASPSAGSDTPGDPEAVARLEAALKQATERAEAAEKAAGGSTVDLQAEASRWLRKQTEDLRKEGELRAKAKLHEATTAIETELTAAKTQLEQANARADEAERRATELEASSRAEQASEPVEEGDPASPAAQPTRAEDPATGERPPLEAGNPEAPRDDPPTAIQPVQPGDAAQPPTEVAEAPETAEPSPGFRGRRTSLRTPGILSPPPEPADPAAPPSPGSAGDPPASIAELAAEAEALAEDASGAPAGAELEAPSWVPDEPEAGAEPAEQQQPEPPPEAEAGDPQTEPAVGGDSAAPISLATAGLEQLQQLGMSTTQAKRVILYRDERGGFGSIEELNEVPGFPPGLLDQVKERLVL
ncbi:MAG: helix-hairpin-helix domain-containing protein, partial [Solirubrobacterales bacterium]